MKIIYPVEREVSNEWIIQHAIDNHKTELLKKLYRGNGIPHQHVIDVIEDHLKEIYTKPYYRLKLARFYLQDRGLVTFAKYTK